MDLLTRQDHGTDETLRSLQMAVLGYFPLLRDREIRLLDIQPGNFPEILRLTLYHAFLDQTISQSYDAISYMWGAPTDPIKVFVSFVSPDYKVHNDELLIGQNLATALKHLRYADMPRTVWADAICINQLDYGERAKQVLMMGDIYHLTRRVVAFLGPEQDDSDFAIEFLESMGDKIDVDFGAGVAKPSASGSDDSGWADAQLELRLRERETWSIYYFLRREWFERLWIRQEIGLGEREAVLQCGHTQIRWRTFCKAIFILNRKPLVADGFDAVHWRTFRERLITADTVSIYSRRSFSFSNLRRQISSSKCSDMRDRIYGVLGQLRETEFLGLIPDYSMSVAEVYTDTTKRYIEHFGKLSILSQCELPTLGPILDLPTWVPDWSGSLSSSLVHAVLPPLFDLLTGNFTMNSALLQAYGIQCGIVSRVLGVYEVAQPFGCPAEIARGLQKLLHEAEKHAPVQPVYVNREDVLEAYTRTLWVDNFGDRWLPNSSHEPAYQDCISLVRVLVESGIDLITQAFPRQTDINRCLNRAHRACTGRALFSTEDGRIGLAPASLAAGDDLCLLFSCCKPLVLRPVSDAENPEKGRHTVVGECYLHGMMYGQALLGDLPDNLRVLLKADSSMGLRSAGFIDTGTKLVSQEDPRVGPFLTGLVKKRLLLEPAIQELDETGILKILIKADYPVRTFDMI